VTQALLDARMAIRGLGISTFVERLLDGFATNDDTDLTVWRGAGGWDRAGRISTLAHSGLFDVSPRLDPRTRPFDVVHYLSNIGAVFPVRGTVLTVYDLLHRLRQRRRDRVTGFLLERCLLQAARIVAVSDRTRREIVHAFPQLEGRVEVIPSGMRRFPAPAGERAHILAFGGGHDPRKRVDLLVEVYAEYRATTPDPLPLVVLARAGLAGDQPRRLAELEARIVTRADGAEVDGLLAGAAAVIYPTIAEGYGFPILEAAEFRTPVVLDATADVATELVGRHCFRVEGTAPAQWAEAVRRAVRGGPVENPLTLPDWPTVAARYRELYEDVAPA
jgi:glycosyltransferase involved in cell wall biosynthesis